MELQIFMITAFTAISIFVFIIFLLVIVRKGYDFQLLCGFVLSFVMSLSLLATLMGMVKPSGNFLMTLRFTLILFHINLLAILCTIHYHIKEPNNKILLVGFIVTTLLLVTSISIPDRFIYSPDFGFHLFWRILLYIWMFTFSVIALFINTKNRQKIGMMSLMMIGSGIFLIILVPIASIFLTDEPGNPVEFLPYALFGCFFILVYHLFNDMLNELIHRKPIIMKETGWKHLFDRLDVIAVVLDRMGHVESVNPYFLKITGYQADEVMGKDWFAFFLPGSGQYDVQSAFIEILEYEFHPKYRNAILTKNKEERMIDWHNMRILNPDGIVTGSLSIGIDITEDLNECERVKKKLQEAEEILQQLRRDQGLS